MLSSFQIDKSGDVFDKNALSRKKTSQKTACTNCRRRRVRCDSKQPCGSCESYRETVSCDYLNHPKKQKSSRQSYLPLREYKKILETIFPTTNVIELRGLPREKLLEIILKDGPVSANSPRSDGIEKLLPYTSSRISSSKPDLTSGEICSASYTQPIHEGSTIEADTALFPPISCSLDLGPVVSLQQPTINWETTSTFGHNVVSPQTMWESQCGQQAAKGYSPDCIGWRGDHLDTYLRQCIEPLPPLVDMESHTQSTFQQSSLCADNFHLWTPPEPPTGNFEPHMNELSTSAIGFAIPSGCYNSMSQPEVGYGFGQTSGNHSRLIEIPSNGTDYWSGVNRRMDLSDEPPQVSWMPHERVSSN